MKYIAPQTKQILVESFNGLCQTSGGGQGLNSQKGEGEQLSPARKLYI